MVVKLALLCVVCFALERYILEVSSWPYTNKEWTALTYLLLNTSQVPAGVSPAAGLINGMAICVETWETGNLEILSSSARRQHILELLCFVFAMCPVEIR